MWHDEHGSQSVQHRLRHRRATASPTAKKGRRNVHGRSAPGELDHLASNKSIIGIAERSTQTPRLPQLTTVAFHPICTILTLTLISSNMFGLCTATTASCGSVQVFRKRVLSSALQSS